jgi:predicted nucleic acid-binding protein
MGEARVIANSSVLIVFARAGRLALLHRTVGAISITREVEQEAILAAPERADAQALAGALERGHVVIITAKKPRIAEVLKRYPNLGVGEASVIAAAMDGGELTLLVDERPARRAGTLEGLQVVGSLGLLARARRSRILKSNQELSSALRDLLSAGLWVAPEVVEAFWEGVGGREG